MSALSSFSIFIHKQHHYHTFSHSQATSSYDDDALFKGKSWKPHFFAMSANLGPAGYTYFLQTLPAFWYLKKKKAEAANLSKSSMRMLTRTTLPLPPKHV